MKELLYALPGGAADAGADFGLVPAHMTYEIAAGPKLTGIGLTPDIRGGAMLIACSGGTESGEPQYCCRQVLGECLRRGFDRVILDYERDAGPAAQRLAAGLGRTCAQRGLPLYLPEPLAQSAPGCRVLVSSRLLSGTLEAVLRDAMTRWGREQVVLAIDAGAEDYPLPVAGRSGAPLEPERLRTMMGRLEPAVFFDRGLCAHYFTYMAQGGQAHFILFDTARSVREKLNTAQRLGVPSALLAAPQVAGWLGEIFD